MYKFWIKKGASSAIDIYATWGIRVKSIPPKPLPNPKSYAKRSWRDQQGDDEYIPSEGIWSAYEVDIKFEYDGEIGSIAKNVIAFLQYIQGAEIGFKDEYTGREGVFRYKELQDDAIYHQEEEAIEFTITFKVNKPDTLSGI